MEVKINCNEKERDLDMEDLEFYLARRQNGSLCILLKSYGIYPYNKDEEESDVICFSEDGSVTHGRESFFKKELEILRKVTNKIKLIYGGEASK